MTVDNQTFSDFVNNALPQARMVEVEARLRADGEADAAISAAMLNYDLNTARAHDLAGDEFFCGEKDRLESEPLSIKANIRKSNLNSTTMNNQFTTEELNAINAIVANINAACDPALSLDENLVRFYLNARPGTFPEDAHVIIQGLRNGVTTFNSQLSEALKQGDYDYQTRLHEMSADMAPAERYEIYLNFIAALRTMAVSNLSPDQASELEDFAAIRGRLQPAGEVTEEMIADAERQIAELLRDNTFCMGSVESLKELVESLPAGQQAVEEHVLASEQDMRDKLITAAAAYIAYQNEELPSLAAREFTPEAMAVMVSAGVEEAHVMTDLATGRTTVDRAIHILKIIGGIALTLLLFGAMVIGVAHIALFTDGMLMLLLGSQLIATVGAVAVLLWLSNVGTDVVAGIVSWSSRVFDLVVNTWRKQAWPRIKAIVGRVTAWLGSLLSRRTVTVAGADAADAARTSPAL